MEHGIDCVSTIPRKTRVYGSVESLTERYRVCMAIIQELFPDKDTTDIEDLRDIAESRGIVLPSSEEIASTPLESVFRDRPVPSRESLARSPALSAASIMKEEPTPKEKPMPLPISPRDRLVPTPTGNTSHYIGPSSSFGFVLTVRRFVGEAVSEVRNGHPALKLMIDFAQSGWSKALEPKVNGEKHTAPGPADLERDVRVTKPSHVIPLVSIKDFSPEAFLSSLLPSQESADLLVRSFFNRSHPTYPLFHRRSFEHRYNSMWSQLDMQIEEFDVGWLCSVVMVLAFGAQVLEPQNDEFKERNRCYYEWVMGKTSQIMRTSTLVNVQALVLLQLYQHNLSERNTAFLVLGFASRMAMNLGMHREGAVQDLDPLERELRRRVWWTIYILEHNSSVILGRPCAIDEREVSVHFPNEELLDEMECVPMGYIEEFVRVTKIMADIVRHMYPPTSMPSPDTAKIMIRNAHKLLSELDTWRDRLPQHLLLDAQVSSPTHMRAIFLLHSQFHLLQSLTTRPFILRKVATQLALKLGKVPSRDFHEDERKLSDKCGLFSKQAIILIHRLITSEQFNGITCTDPFYIYHSVLIVSLDFLAQDKPDTPEDEARKKVVVDIKNAMDGVHLCPLFAILTQVSFQLAEIVGIVENFASNAQAQQLGSAHLEPSIRGVPDMDFGLDNSQQHSVIDFYLQGNQVNLPWKIGSDNFPQTTPVTAPMIDPFMNRGISAMDEHAVAATMSSMQGQMQSPQPYMNSWSGGYDVMPSQTQYGNSAAGPSSLNGNGNGPGQYRTFSLMRQSRVNGIENGNGNGNAHPHDRLSPYMFADHQSGIPTSQQAMSSSQTAMSHNINGSRETHPHMFGDPQSNMSHVNGNDNRNARSHVQYSASQADPSHTNGTSHGLNSYDMQRND